MTRFTVLLAAVLCAVAALLVLAGVCAGGCEYLRPRCAIEGQRRCSGSSIETCGGGRWTWALDCADFDGGQTCRPQGSSAACVPVQPVLQARVTDAGGLVIQVGP